MEYNNDKSKLLLRKAEAVLGVVRKYEQTKPDVYEKFIIGKSTAAIISMNPVTGRPEHNIWAVMETIYDDYRNHPERKINERLQEVLHNTLRHETLSTYLNNAIQELLYQMRSEKEKTAPFSLDCIQLLNDLKANVEENKRKHEISNMMDDIKNYDKIFEENYSCNILK